MHVNGIVPVHVCMIIAKHYLYTASRKEAFYFDAFLVMLTNKIKIEKHKSKSQINPLRPNNDLSQTSHCNIKAVSVSEWS